MGNAYLKGEGVPKDVIEAYAYFNLAGATNADARASLAKLEKELSTEQISTGQKRTDQLGKENATRYESEVVAKIMAQADRETEEIVLGK